MRRRRRWLWWAKWAGMLTCVAAVSLWLGFGRHWGHFVVGPIMLSCGAGSFNVSWGDSPNRDTYGAVVSLTGWHFWVAWPSYRVVQVTLPIPATVGILAVPAWMVTLVVAIPTFVLFRFDRRRIPPDHCHKCGYNLTGNVSGRCPECGTPVKDES